MSENVNHFAMEQSLEPSDLPEEFTRSTALAALWRTFEAARATVDEVSVRTQELTEEELVHLGGVSEQIGSYAEVFYNKLLTETQK